MKILEAQITDIPVIRSIAMASWPVTYSRILSVKQIEYMLGTLYHPAEIQRQMIVGEQQYLLAYLNDEAIGFAAFGPQKEGIDYKLHKLYISPLVQKSGGGKALLDEVEDRVKNLGSKRLILNVHRNNPARKYYEKMGFKIYDVKDIPFGPGFILNDYLMEKEL